MGTEHTPGPWQVKNDWHGLTVVIANVDGETFADGTSSYSYDFICDAGLDEFGDPAEDQRAAMANAKLIAAAPDMLEALQEARERLATMANMTGNRSDDEWVWRAQELVAAAIAKAGQ